jgi:hypothetical protein
LGALLIGCGGSDDTSSGGGGDGSTETSTDGAATGDSSNDAMALGDSKAVDATDGGGSDVTTLPDAADAGLLDGTTGSDASDGSTAMDAGDSAAGPDAGDSGHVAPDASDSAAGPDAGDATVPDASDSGNGPAPDGGDATLPDASDSGNGPTPDASDSGTKLDASDSATPLDGSPDAADASDGALADANDAAPVCGDGAASSACVNPGTGANDFCTANVCSACTDGTDDAKCTAAYGSATHPAYLCLAGACTPGDCRTNADCATSPDGMLCGVDTPNTCGKCSADTQCAKVAVDGGAPICDIATGQCIAAACTPTAGDPPATCTANTSDVCCTANACTPGNCCPGSAGDTFCATHLDAGAATCSAATHACTTCPGVSGNAYAVDPVNGNDQTGNGNGSTLGCAFKTITRALAVIGTPALPTTITILGPATVGAGETFPIVLPDDVNLTTSAGAVTIDVPTGKSGFTLASPNSSIFGGTGAALTISGTTNEATNGIVATTGSAASTQISNLTVTAFANDGILVENAGILTIGAGVTSSFNGTAAAAHDGLHVTGTGHAIIDVPTGQAPTHFDNNTNHGILVDGTGSIALTGVVTSATAGTGTITTNTNNLAGLWLAQTPGTVAAPVPENVVDGLVSFGNTGGNGIRIVAGSAIQLRNSATLGNSASGVNVSSAGFGPGGSNDISHIDLGSPATADASASFGNNIFQEALGAAGHNVGVGICLQTRAGAGTLLAAGNEFGATDCSAAADAGGMALTVNATCNGGVDIGITAPGNDIDVSNCTHP